MPILDWFCTQVFAPGIHIGMYCDMYCYVLDKYWLVLKTNTGQYIPILWICIGFFLQIYSNLQTPGSVVKVRNNVSQATLV